jgi:hypothetical protein
MMGKKILENARKAFGPAPARWPGTLRVVTAIEELPAIEQSPSGPPGLT